jgi:hypothetical protein
VGGTWRSGSPPHPQTSPPRRPPTHRPRYWGHRAAHPHRYDTRERYAYKFTGQQVTTTKQALACGDYAIELDGAVVASVERKSLTDLVSSLINGTLRYALGDLATLPRAAVVVEDRYTQHYVRPAQVADGLAELQGAGYTVIRLGSSRPDGAAPNGDLVVATTVAAHRPVFVDEAHPAQQRAPAG